MARRKNYGFEKQQRERRRQKKKEEKAEKKRLQKEAADGPLEEGVEADGDEDPETGDQTSAAVDPKDDATT